MACYGKGNPATKQEVEAMWKWMEPHLRSGASIESMWDHVNQQLYGGMGKPKWISDVLSGRKTTNAKLGKQLWAAQYKSRIAQGAAAMATRTAAMGKVARYTLLAVNAPRMLATLGHGVVFPITHAGDLIFRPFTGSAVPYASFIKGIFKTYRSALPFTGKGGKAYIARELAIAEHDPMYSLATDSGLDFGRHSHPTGILSGGSTLPSQRAWDALGLMRLDLWKNVMSKQLKSDMTQAEALQLGKVVADWTNHATGSGKGPIANIGGNWLFGPKLTQAKLNKLFKDPGTAGAATLRVFGDMARGKKVNAADWTAAQLRFSGAAQNLATRIGFMYVNQAYLNATGDDRKVNMEIPFLGDDPASIYNSDYFALKGPGGVDWTVPGIQSELKTFARILALRSLDSRQMSKLFRTDNRYMAGLDTLVRYAFAKGTPTVAHGWEGITGQNYQGKPLPGPLGAEGSRRQEPLTAGEYAAQIGPIPLEGPAAYMYDQLKEQGISGLDATKIVRGLILFGGGYAGFHGHVDKASGE